MFKIELDYNGCVMDYTFNFQTAWAANLKAREICNALCVNAHVYDNHNHVYVAHYWAD